MGVGEAGEVEGMPGHGVVAGGNGFSELYFEGMDCFGNPQVGAGDEDGIHGGMIADLEDGAFDGVRGDPADEVVIIDIEGRHRRHFDSFLLEQTAHLQVQFVPVGSEQGHPGDIESAQGFDRGGEGIGHADPGFGILAEGFDPRGSDHHRGRGASVGDHIEGHSGQDHLHRILKPAFHRGEGFGIDARFIEDAALVKPDPGEIQDFAEFMLDHMIGGQHHQPDRSPGTDGIVQFVGTLLKTDFGVQKTSRKKEFQFRYENEASNRESTYSPHRMGG